MFRSFLLTTLMIFSTASVSANFNYMTPEDEHVLPASDDRWVPWPWTMAQPFPWGDIQGLWKVEQGDFSSYFALKVVRQKTTGIRQLQIKQYDGETCRLLANGVGIERNLRVLAQMTSRSGTTYRVQFTAFNEKDSPLPPLKSRVPIRGVMVLSMGPLVDSHESDSMVHMQIMKVSALLTQKGCIDDIKK